MLKALRTRHRAMVVLAVLAGAVIAMSYYAEHRKEIYGRHAKPSKPVAPVTKSDTGDAVADANESEYPPSWIDTFAWPEGATAWFLLFTLFVIAWQSAETRSAAKASKKSAQAALAQIKIMKQSADIGKGATVPTLRVLKFNMGGSDPLVDNEMELTVRNYGATPAILDPLYISFDDGERWPTAEGTPVAYDDGGGGQ
jgi:hypothetical protein